MAGSEITGLPTGLYESVVTTRLAELLDQLDSRVVVRRPVHPAEVPDRVALHLGRLVERVLRSVATDERAASGIAAVDGVLDALTRIAPAGLNLDGDRLSGAVEVLTAITTLLPDSTPRAIDEPLIPLLDTTLLTNAPNEPRVGHQIAAEIGSAQRIDVLMAFIRLSGINPLIERIRDHCQRGGTIRVLTTTYTGSTQRIALDRLVEAGAIVRVSYDVSTTRLHAKSWLFHRESGFSTAYIGSSNLTHSAQQAGLEWNVRASSARNPDVIDKVAAVFESYWSSQDFVDFDPAEFDERTAQPDERPRPCTWARSRSPRSPSKSACSSSLLSNGQRHDIETCSSLPRAPAKR